MVALSSGWSVRVETFARRCEFRKSRRTKGKRRVAGVYQGIWTGIVERCS